MSFEHWELIYYIVIIVVIFLLLYKSYEKKSLTWIKQYFFKKPTKPYLIKNIFFYLGIGLFALASLDLRGPEESVKIEMRSQKTAILVDVSASMAVEDIRPNRFEKALMVAMHFVKKSAGHKIAVFIFSNETKQVVPFTDDIDHINARIEALDQYRTLSGTSNLSLAINEVSKFFIEEGSDGGNILVFTDGEEHSSSMDINLEKNISLGVVGIGTGKGGKIPIRDNFNVLRGYKKHNGQEVVSKLNEEFLKNSFKSVDNFRYWIVGGYVIPTDEILAFFKNSFIKRKQEGIQRIRPVWGNFLLVPACILIALSYLLGHFKLLRGITAACLLIVFSDFTYANEGEKETPLSKEESAELNELLSLHKKGELSKNDEKYLASKFLKQKEYNKAATIYEDAIKFPEHEDANTLMNYGTSLIGGKRLSDGVDMLELALSKIPKEDKETREQIKQNILLALKQQEQQKKQKKQNKKDKNKDKNKKNNKNNQKKDKNGKKEKDKQDKNGKDKKEDQKEKDSKKGDNDKDKKQDEQKQGKMKRKKMSALMKEILNDDKKLQKKLLDTSRGNKKGGSSEKDW